MARLFDPPHSITVILNAANQRPTRFVWQGVTYPIERVIEELEWDTGWWEASGRVWRKSLAVTTNDGMLCLLECDLLTGEWGMRKLYD